jgi:hypothetical protein
MRPFPIFIAALFCACDAPPRVDEESLDAAAATPTQITSDLSTPTVPADSVVAPSPASSPGAGSSDAAGQGSAELRRLAAARQSIRVHGGEEDVENFNASEFVADEMSPPAYAGMYHFGDSEGESTLTLTVQGNTLAGTLQYSVWENETWVGKEVRLDDGRIAGARLIAPEWDGVFVRFRGQPGLVILRAPTDRLGVEFGNKLDPRQE